MAGARGPRWWAFRLALAAGLPLPAGAQTLDRYAPLDVPGFGTEPGVTVLSRLRPDADPVGIRAGAFTIRPEIATLAGYDSNVLGTRGGPGSAEIDTGARVTARSDWGRDSLNAAAAIDDTRYPDQPRQSYTDATASLGGTIDIGRDTLGLDYQHQSLNQTARDLDTPRLDRPIAYRVDGVEIGYRTGFDRLSVRPALGVSRYAYDDGSVAGAPYPQRFRDRDVITPSVIVGYDLAPHRTLIGVLRDASAAYRAPAPGAPRRDYTDVAALAGIDYEGGLWRYRALSGFESRSFASPSFKAIQAPVAELTVIVSPTGLTTFTATLLRRIEDSSDETTTGYTETSGRLAVDHEYRRNVLLRAQGGVLRDDYPAHGSQTLLTAGASATWLIARGLRLAASYDIRARESSASGTLGPSAAQSARFGGNYTESRYLLRVAFGL